jgi:hypothetical protein
VLAGNWAALGFHARTDARYSRYLNDEFAGIDSFPFRSVQLSLLAVHARLVQLAEVLLQDDDIRIYSAEAWANTPAPLTTIRPCIATT